MGPRVYTFSFEISKMIPVPNKLIMIKIVAIINGMAKILDFFLMRSKFLWIWYSTNKHQQYPMMPELAEEIVFEIYCKIWKIKA